MSENTPRIGERENLRRKVEHLTLTGKQMFHGSPVRPTEPTPSQILKSGVRWRQQRVAGTRDIETRDIETATLRQGKGETENEWDSQSGELTPRCVWLGL